MVGIWAGQSAGASATKACTAKSLTLRFEGRKDGLNEVERYVLLRNRADAPCALAATPEAAAVFVSEGDFDQGVQVTVKRPPTPAPRLVLRQREEALLVLTYGQCLPPDRTKRTYLNVLLRGSGPGRGVSVDAPSEPLTLDGGAIQRSSPSPSARSAAWGECRPRRVRISESGITRDLTRR